MDKRRQERISKFLSYVLRHRPDQIGIKLDNAGWASVPELLREANRHGISLTPDELEAVVKENNKQRFSFSEDGRRIRANYGHSVSVDLGYEPVMPPTVLYHGTAQRNLKSIRTNGLARGNRHYVHLSPDTVSARAVGQRHGKPIILEIEAGQMFSDGYNFDLSAGAIWLTEYVPAEYVRFPEDSM